VATIPGDLPAARDQYVYVIAHYDSRAKDVMDPEAPAPGANDDASGVAVVLELARVLAPHRFDATIILMATAGEEQGLVGARAHARAAKAAGRQVRAVLNNDIVGDPTSPDGRRTDRVIRLFSATLPPEPAAADYARLRELSGVHDSPSRAVARHIGEIAAWEATTVQPALIFRHDRFLRGGDHTAFSDEGFPAVRFCEVDEDYTRQHEDPRTENGVAYGDTAQWVDAQYLAGVAILNATAAIHLANAPATPSGARIDTRELSNTTTVRWDANIEPDLAGYEVLWRETTSAVWQHARDVGIGTSVTLPISKDDHFFGVRAYDRDGYRSVAAFPGVER
jgi:Zn-dependent M28 family amino/carboxypeptidase